MTKFENYRIEIMPQDTTEVHRLKTAIEAQNKSLKKAYEHIDLLNHKISEALKPRTVKEKELKDLRLLLTSAQAEVKVLRGMNQRLQMNGALSYRYNIIGASQRQEGLRRIQSELLNILDESVLTKARREFYERHIHELDTENLLILLRYIQFSDSIK